MGYVPSADRFREFQGVVARARAAGDRAPQDVREPEAIVDVRPADDEGECDASRVHQGVAVGAFPPRSVGFGPVAPPPKGALQRAPSAARQGQAMPANLSHSARSAC